MGTITGQNIADRAWIILQDTIGTPGTRWPAAEVLYWINDGQREVVITLPTAFIKTVIAAALGDTRQTLTGMGITDGIQFIKCPRNFNAAGTTPGRAVTMRSMAWIDDQRPLWHADTAADAVHCMFDPNDPKTFYIWPKGDGTKKIEVVYAALPPDVAAIGNAIALDDVYANSLINYVLFRAFQKNSKNTKSPQLAGGYYQLFLQSLGVKDARVKALDANLQMVNDGTEVVAGGKGAN